MTELHFQKWQATGNDFIIIDNRLGHFSDLSAKQIESLCDRKFGIGADGFMMIQTHPTLDFEMRYFNSDGIEAEMCGNGARSIIGYTKQLGIIGNGTRFMAVDGPHDGLVLGNSEYQINMINVNRIIESPLKLSSDQNTDNRTALFLNTGVPHLVVFVDRNDDLDVAVEGRKIRNMDRFKPSGTNVNFVSVNKRSLNVRTYERGVENETLSCGTGAVASAIAMEYLNELETETKLCVSTIEVPGGRLSVQFTRTSTEKFEDIYLSGPAKMVFKGQINLFSSPV
jgi:diaminopimelate epimerase